MNDSEISRVAQRMRQDCLDMGLAAGGSGAHMGGSLSCIEILAVLYFSVMNGYATEIEEVHDRLIFSKGHGAMAQYAALHQLGVINDEELLSYKKDGTALTVHPAVNERMGIDFATGSLGQGLSFGVGVAMALEKKQQEQKVYVILGDGECNEGSVWEAAMAAAHFGLDNLVAVVDVNGFQCDDSAEAVMDMSPLVQKWESFGWNVSEADGHNVESLKKSFEDTIKGKPHVVIANTVKGKGVNFMESNPIWHNYRLTSALHSDACAALEEE